MNKLAVHMRNSGLDSFLTFGDELVPGVQMVIATQIDGTEEVHISAIMRADEVDFIDEKELAEENEELKAKIAELERERGE
jgi:hypothetical protein